MTIDRPAPEQLPELKSLWRQAFGDTEEFIDRFFVTGFHPDRCMTVTAENTVCAALYWFDCLWQGRKLAYVYAVATGKAYRRQGLCRRLMEATHVRLQAQGYWGAVLVPGNDSLFSLYEKLGYTPFCPTTTHRILPGDTPCVLRPVNADTFGQLRSSMLPDNAVEQDGEDLAFAATFLDFYIGSGTLFAVARERDTLHFQEFLGDPAQLPGIVNALGAAQGIVRLPGQTPFAMYRSLCDSKEIPSYFGIALN